MEIRFIDSICGSGKSTAMMSEINKSNIMEKYIYCTPFLTEAQRIADGCIQSSFKQPSSISQSKSSNFIDLVNDGANVSISHELLKNISTSAMNNLEEYNLILDETMNLIEIYTHTTMKDIRKMIEMKVLEVDEKSKRLVMLDSNFFELDSLKTIRRLLKGKKLYLYGEKTIICDISIELLSKFKSVTIMSYLIEGSYLYHLIKSADITIIKKQISDNHEIIDWDENLARTRAKKYYDLIEFYNEPSDKKNLYGKIDNITQNLNYSSQNKLGENRKDKIGKIIRSYFRGEKTNYSNCLYSNFGKKLDVKDYRRSFLVFNSRATNDYKETSVLAYIIEKNNNPALKNYVKGKYDVLVDEDKQALDCMIQWIFRSRLRDKKEIKLFLPSIKMRRLLYQWAH